MHYYAMGEYETLQRLTDEKFAQETMHLASKALGDQ